MQDGKTQNKIPVAAKQVIIAFACNAESFSIAIIFFFSFSFLLELLDRPPKVVL